MIIIIIIIIIINNPFKSAPIWGGGMKAQCDDDGGRLTQVMGQSCSGRSGCIEREIGFPSELLLYTGLFVSPSGISELDCATTKTDTAERSISIGRESLLVFFVLGALAYFQIPPLGGSREEKWRSQ